MDAKLGLIGSRSVVGLSVVDQGVLLPCRQRVGHMSWLDTAMVASSAVELRSKRVLWSTHLPRSCTHH